MLRSRIPKMTRTAWAVVFAAALIPSFETNSASASHVSAKPAQLKLVKTVGGTSMSPKSIVASPTGLVIAQNMMYTHGISVFNAEGQMLKRISDSLPLRKLGRKGSGSAQGSPVEAAFSPDGAYAYVSNYYMTGPGFARQGFDKCSESAKFDNGFLYRVNMSTKEVEAAVEVGEVPKYVAVSPDNKYALVSNWCSYSISIIDLATFQVVKTIKVGRYPRGIVVAHDSSKAYITVMGAAQLGTIDLTTFALHKWRSAANTPRHIVLSPDGLTLYVSHNLSSVVTSHDSATGRLLKRVVTGTEPRTMAISPEGDALYVVNYQSGTMTVVSTAKMKVSQRITTPPHPIGVTFEPTLNRVWVACYSGLIKIYART